MNGNGRGSLRPAASNSPIGGCCRHQKPSFQVGGTGSSNSIQDEAIWLGHMTGEEQLAAASSMRIFVFHLLGGGGGRQRLLLLLLLPLRLSFFGDSASSLDISPWHSRGRSGGSTGDSQEWGLWGGWHTWYLYLDTLFLKK